MKKPSGIREAIAKKDGFYSKKGEKLKGASLSQEQVDQWNGLVKVEQPKEEIVISSSEEVVTTSPEPEVVIEQPVVEESVIEKVAKRFGRKKK